ncbi:MAG: hypothetical protein M3Y56_02060 [Armatimonadota bacterium]|nr:hypothetical protein [Armatimonadota bacterium]
MFPNIRWQVQTARLSNLFLCLILSTATQAATIETHRAALALQYVSVRGQIPPQMVLNVDYHPYPKGTSFRTFVASEPVITPEAVVSRYLSVAKDPAGNLASILPLYSPSEDTTKVIDNYEQDRKFLESYKDVTLLRRYDIGQKCYLLASYITPDNQVFATGIYVVRRLQNRYVLTLHSLFGGGIIEELIYEVEWNFDNLGEQWNTAPRPRFKYVLNLPIPDDPSQIHPVSVSFNGEIHDLLIDSHTVAADKLTQFLKKAVETYRHGTRAEWLSLWTHTDVVEWWDNPQRESPAQYGSERARFNSASFSLVFTMNFGPTAAAFFQDGISNGSPLQFLVVWKDPTTGYRLTGGEALKSGQLTLDDNIQHLFQSAAFQDYVKKLLPKHFSAGSASKNIRAGSSKRDLRD